MPLLTTGAGVYPAAAAGGSSPAFKFKSSGVISTGTSVTWTVSGGTIAAGDIAVVFADMGDPVGPTFSTPFGTATPSGFTDIFTSYDGAHNGGAAYVGYKVCAGGETSFASGTLARNVQGVYGLIVISGATVIDGNSSALAGSASATMPAAAIPPTASNALLIAWGTVNAGGFTGVSNFSGMTSQIDTAGSVTLQNQNQLYVATQVLSASGTTGTRAATQSGSDFYYSGLIAFK